MESKEVALARAIYALEQKKEALAAEAKALAEQLGAKEEELLSYLVAEGKKSTGHIEGIGIFSVARKNYPSVTQARMPQFLDYLRQGGDEKLIVETVPAQSLQKYCKDRLEGLTNLFVEDPDQVGEYEELETVENADQLSPADLARAVLKAHGVETFSQTKLAHTKRGK